MQEPQISNIVLENGVKLIVDRDSHASTIAVMVLIGAGSRQADQRTMGLAHFYEHLVVMGTENFPTNLEFTLKLEEIGADFNAFTAEEYTAFYVKTEPRYLPLAVKMLSELVVRPLLIESEIKREKNVILEEINMREDTPQIKVVDRMVELLFEGTGLGLPGIGTKETVNSFEKADFVGFKKKYYRGGQLVVAISGNVGSDLELKPLIEDNFGSLAKGSAYLPEDLQLKLQDARIEIVNKPTDQIHLAMGFLGLSRRDPERYAQSLLAIILGAGFSSRLFQKVRQQRSLAYSVGTDTEMYSDTGLFMIDAGVDKLRVEEAVEVILEELNIIKNSGARIQNAEFGIGNSALTEVELKKAKSYVRGKMALRWEDSMSRAMWYGVQALLDPEILSTEQVIAKLEAVTLKDVEETAQLLFKPERMALVAVNGDLKEEKIRNIIEKWN